VTAPELSETVRCARISLPNEGRMDEGGSVVRKPGIPILLVRQMMIFCTQKVENIKSKTGKETHPEVDLSTLAVCYGALIEYLKEYIVTS
jgi:hypothetical protein